MLTQSAKNTDSSGNSISCTVSCGFLEEAQVSRTGMSRGPDNYSKPFITGGYLWDDISELKNPQRSSRCALVDSDKRDLSTRRRGLSAHRPGCAHGSPKTTGVEESCVLRGSLQSNARRAFYQGGQHQPWVVVRSWKSFSGSADPGYV